MLSQRLSAIVLISVVALLAVACRDDKPESIAEPPVAAETAATPAGAAAQSPRIRDPRFTALPGARADFGVLNGAAYRIEVPHNWNGGLVLYAHGYRGEGPDLTVGDPPIRRHLIRGGYAWAASSYRMNGYRPDVGLDDTLALKAHFAQKYGRPRWTVIEGTSMGGHVLFAALELHPDAFQGALAECPAIGNGVIDYLAAFAAVAEYIGGVDLLGSPDAQTYMRRVVAEWLPAVGFAQTPTDKGRALLSVGKHLMGGEFPFWREGFMTRFTQAANLLVLGDPSRRDSPASRALDTRDVQYRIDPGLGYTADELNQNVRRFERLAGPPASAQDRVFEDLTGRINVPVISLHTTGDAFVPFTLEQQYRRLTLAAGTSDLLVQRAIRRPAHCQFEGAELTRAFDDLVAWIERGVKPEGDDVLATDLSTLGLRWTTPLLPEDPAGR
jgi:pimeloyl-ACP methyl ester carboxylesterase